MKTFQLRGGFLFVNFRSALLGVGRLDPLFSLFLLPILLADRAVRFLVPRMVRSHTFCTATGCDLKIALIILQELADVGVDIPMILKVGPYGVEVSK